MKDSVMLALICLAIVAASATFQPPRQVISFDSRYRLLQTCPSQPAFRTPSLVGSVRPMFRAQLRSSNESPEGVGNSPSGIDARIADVEKQIGQVEAQIIKVEGQIEEAGERAENASTEREMERWWKEKEDLRKKEEDLRKEKEDLRKEKEDLRKERMMLLEAQIALTTKPEGGPLAPKDSYEAFVTGLLDRFESLPGPEILFGDGREFPFMERNKSPFRSLMDTIQGNRQKYGANITENRKYVPIAMIAGGSGCGKTRKAEECDGWMQEWLKETEIDGETGGKVLAIPINYNGGSKVDGLDDESPFYKLHMTSPAKAFRWRVVRAIFHPSMSLEEFGRTVYQPGLDLDLADLVRRVAAKYGKKAVLFLVDELLLSQGEREQRNALSNGAVPQYTDLLSSVSTVVQNLNAHVLTVLVCTSLTPGVRETGKSGSNRDVVVLPTPSISMPCMESVTIQSVAEGELWKPPCRVLDLLAVTGGHPRTFFDFCLPALNNRREKILSNNGTQVKQAVEEVYHEMIEMTLKKVPLLGETETKEFLTFGCLRHGVSTLNCPDSSGGCMSRQDRFVAQGELREHVVGGTNITTIPSICLLQVLAKCKNPWSRPLERALNQERSAEVLPDDNNRGKGGQEFQQTITEYLRARCIAANGSWLSFEHLFGKTAKYLEGKASLGMDVQEFQLPQHCVTVSGMKEADSNLLMSSFVASLNDTEVGIEGTFPLRGNDQRVYLIALQCKWRKEFYRSAVEEARSKMKQAVDRLKDRVNCPIIPLYIINRLDETKVTFDHGDPEGPEIWVHGQGAVAEMFPLLVNSIRWGKYLED